MTKIHKTKQSQTENDRQTNRITMKDAQMKKIKDRTEQLWFVVLFIHVVLEATVWTTSIVPTLVYYWLYILKFWYVRPSGHQLKLERYRED